MDGDLNEQDVHLSIAHHTFSIHLIDHASGRYLGMVCHFNQCPKHKREWQVPGAGPRASSGSCRGSNSNPTD